MKQGVKTGVIYLLLLTFSFLLLQSCASVPDKGKQEKKSDVIKVPAGTNMPSLGMALDASYDPDLDNIVPGYKILSIAITNNSPDVMQLDKDMDKWEVVDLKGSRHKAILDLRLEDPKKYTSLPEKLQALIQYPLIVQVGETKVVDLLFRDSVNLTSFRAVRLQNKKTPQIIEIVSGY